MTLVVTFRRTLPCAVWTVTVWRFGRNVWFFLGARRFHAPECGWRLRCPFMGPEPDTWHTRDMSQLLVNGNDPHLSQKAHARRMMFGLGAQPLRKHGEYTPKTNRESRHRMSGAFGSGASRLVSTGCIRAGDGLDVVGHG